jgi:chromosome segregation ATPase
MKPFEGWKERTLQHQRELAPEAVRLKAKVNELNDIADKLYRDNKDVRRFVGLQRYIEQHKGTLLDIELKLSDTVIELLNGDKNT